MNANRFDYRHWLAALALALFLIPFATRTAAQPTPPPPSVQITAPGPQLQADSSELTAVLDGPSQKWNVVLTPNTAFSEHSIQWTAKQGTFTLATEKTVTQANGLPRKWSFNQPITFGDIEITATTLWADGSTIKTYTLTANGNGAPEGEIRCGSINRQAVCAYSRPVTAPDTDAAINWTVGVNGSGVQPFTLSQQPGKQLAIPGQYVGKMIRVVAAGVDNDKNWELVWDGLIVGEVYLPLVNNLIAQNPPPPTQTPPPSSPTPTPPPAAQPIFTNNRAESRIEVSMNGADPGVKWLWGMKAPGFFDYGYSPEVSPGTMLSYINGQTGQPYGYPLDVKLVVTHADNSQSVYTAHFDN